MKSSIPTMFAHYFAIGYIADVSYSHCVSPIYTILGIVLIQTDQINLKFVIYETAG